MFLKHTNVLLGLVEENLEKMYIAIMYTSSWVDHYMYRFGEMELCQAGWKCHILFMGYHLAGHLDQKVSCSLLDI